MGMAASQSRYLGITARKINVEYEGQQVNQQRTALANESAGLFNKLLGLEVPTAPTQSDYYTDQYTYNDPASADGKTVLSSITENEGSDPKTYTVVTTSKITVPQYGMLNEQNVAVSSTSGSYKIQLSNGNQFTLSSAIKGISEEEAEAFNKAGNVTYNEASDTYYKFSNAEANVTYYINATKTGFDPNVTTSQTVDFFTIMPTEQEVTKTIDNATLTTSSGGLYNSIQWTEEDGNTFSYALTQTQSYDERGYDDAMNQYNYEKQVYEKEVADINAKTKKLQETDRTLELRLKQLDTEQQALQTELDSVKKVIDKNVESVFKTFQ